MVSRHGKEKTSFSAFENKKRAFMKKMEGKPKFYFVTISQHLRIF